MRWDFAGLKTCATVLALIIATPAFAQTVTERGFAEVRGQVFAEDSRTDIGRAIADGLVREEVFVRKS